MADRLHYLRQALLQQYIKRLYRSKRAMLCDFATVASSQWVYVNWAWRYRTITHNKTSDLPAQLFPGFADYVEEFHGITASAAGRDGLNEPCCSVHPCIDSGRIWL